MYKASFKNILKRLKVLELAQRFNYKLSFCNKNSVHPRKRQYLFFKQFIKPGDLVFDIGANIGERVSMFLELDAKVVAVEPQLYCIEYIKQNYKDTKLILENIGLSNQNGEMTLYICDQDNRLSTFSENQMNDSFFSQSTQWNRKVNIEVKTLDYLIQKYGNPVFCKIDVEGFEEAVLGGLSIPIPSLSFEFSSKRLGDVENCLRILDKLNNNYKYNICFGEPYSLESNDWMTKNEILDSIISRSKTESTHSWGDIYAKM